MSKSAPRGARREWTDDQVTELRRLYREGASIGEIARHFGLSDYSASAAVAAFKVTRA